MKGLIPSLLLLMLSQLTLATQLNYTNIKSRHSATALDSKQHKHAMMQGECLVGVKQLNYKKKETFDPVAEWSSFRTRSLLEHYSPCEVLIMLEVAQKKLRAEIHSKQNPDL